MKKMFFASAFFLLLVGLVFGFMIGCVSSGTGQGSYDPGGDVAAKCQIYADSNSNCEGDLGESSEELFDECMEYQSMDPFWQCAFDCGDVYTEEFGITCADYWTCLEECE